MLHPVMPQALLRQRDRNAVEVLVQRNARKLKERGNQVGVRRRERGDLASGDARPARDEGDVDVLLAAAGLARWQTVVADVEAVVGCVEQVRVGEDLRVGLELGDDVVDQLVDGLQGLQAAAIEVVVVLDLVVVELGDVEEADGAGLRAFRSVKSAVMVYIQSRTKMAFVRGERAVPPRPCRHAHRHLATYLVGVKVATAGDLDAREEVLVAVGRNWGQELGAAGLAEDRLRVRADGRDAEEEWLLGVDGVAEELDGPVGDEVGGVLARVELELAVVENRRRVEVAVRVGVDEDCQINVSQNCPTETGQIGR